MTLRLDLLPFTRLARLLGLAWRCGWQIGGAR